MTKQKIIELYIQEVLKKYPGFDQKSAKSLIEKAFVTHEVENIDQNEVKGWLSKKIYPNIFSLDKDIYLQACIQALKIQFIIAGTDFGSSRQRDLGQKWADTIRGYLGEFGVKQWLKRNFDVDIDLGHEEGKIEEFLPTDIHKVKLPHEFKFRKPKIKVSIKTTKVNGIWLDIPGDQFHHSDLFILTKIAIGTDHLFSFFKEISVFRDKILKCAQDEGCIDQETAEELYEKIPSFSKIYGYVAGFIEKSKRYDSPIYEGKMGRRNYKIFNWAGKFEKDYLNEIKQDKHAKKASFEGIGQFSQSNRYIFGMKGLKYTVDDWRKHVIDRL